MAMVTESPPEFPFYPDTLPHGNLSRKLNATAAPGRILLVELFRLPEKHRDSFAGDPLCLGLCVLRGHRLPCIRILTLIVGHRN
jgi:hypothetical protein